ncbi:MAG: thioredoxin family protein [Prolixibacteraceae bacterium]
MKKQLFGKLFTANKPGQNPLTTSSMENIGVAGLDIKILGTGCAKCKALEKACREAVEESGITATVSKVEDIVEIMKYNVMTTPALVIDGKVVLKGKVASVKEIISLLNQ